MVQEINSKRVKQTSFEVSISWLASGTSTLLHVGACSALIWGPHAVGLPVRWVGQSTCFVVISWVLSMIACRSDTGVVRIAFSIVRFLLLTVDAYMVPPLHASVLLLALTFPSDLGLTARRPTGFVLPSLLAIGLVFLPVNRVVWGVHVAAPSFGQAIPDILVVLFGGVICAYLGSTWNRLREESAANRTTEQSLTRLIETTKRYEDYSTYIKELSAKDERDRITTEIHDAVGYIFTNIIMMLEAVIIHRTKNISAIPELLAKALDQAKSGLEATRSALHLLKDRPAEKVSLAQALRRLTSSFAVSSGMEVDLEIGNSLPYLGSHIGSTIYRVVRESLTNAIRHGKSTRVWILLWAHEDQLELTVRDNGIGCESVTEGIGLRGMQTRIDELGGELIASNIVDGFQVAVTVPLNVARRT